ncbi:MAG TPA: putative toxin-antitoxin system toxin component, PIN family [Lacipirellulaceae bacterium]|nr:putative toxin-antitoxin system toxin component, PIN family [Lacipirellulaceae bacterium]
MKIVLDTNVLLSAAWRDRLPERVVLYIATNSRCEWLATQPILDEYLAVLQRPRFKLSSEVLRQWATLIEMRTVVIPQPEISAPSLRDPTDAMFLAAAVAAEADFLITGDNDLLSLTLSINTRILSVADFAAHIGRLSAAAASFFSS